MKLVIGPPAIAARFALDNTLEKLRSFDRIAVMDHMGRGAPLLTEKDAWLRQRARVEWHDLSAAQRPTGFTLGAVDDVLPADRLWLVQSLLQAADEFDEEAAFALAGAWERAAKPGRVSLLSSFKLHCTELRASGCDLHSSPGVRAMSFILGFNAVQGCAGDWNPRPALGSSRSVQWYEASHLRLDPRERDAVMAHAMFDLLRLSSIPSLDARLASRGLCKWRVLHLFPSRWALARTSTDVFEHVDSTVVLDGRSALLRARTAQQMLAEATHILVIAGTNVANLPEWLAPAGTGRALGAEGTARLVDHQHRAVTLVSKKLRKPKVHIAHQLRVVAATSQRVRPARPPESHRADLLLEGSTFERIADPVNLLSAWAALRRSGFTGVGADGVSAVDFNEDARERIAKLSTQLLRRSYRPHPVRRIHQRKKSGGRRPIGIPSIKDRIVQRSALRELHGVCDRSLSPSSFAYRPNRSALEAVSRVRDIVTGLSDAVVIQTDIERCFERLDHRLLLEAAARHCDEGTIWLLSQWLKTDVVGDAAMDRRWIGVEQGMPIAPFLANLYLDRLDKFLESNGIVFTRYADDILIVTESEAVAGCTLHTVADFLARELLLDLKPAKTFVTPACNGIDYLGFLIKDAALIPTADRSSALLQKVRTTARRICDSGSALSAAPHIQRLYAILRGFRGYFSAFREPATKHALSELDARIDRVLQRLLPPALLADNVIVNRPRLLPPGTAEADSPGFSTTRAAPVVEYASLEIAAREVADERAHARGATLEIDRGTESERVSFDTLAGMVVVNGRRLRLRAAREGGIEIVAGRERHATAIPEQASAVMLIGTEHQVSSGALRRASQSGVTILVADYFGGAPVVVPARRYVDRSRLRVLQANRVSDPRLIGAGLDMLCAKIGNQSAVLKYFAKYRARVQPAVGDDMRATAAQMSSLARKLAALSPSETNIQAIAMGYEGRAAALYWRALREADGDRDRIGKRELQNAGRPFHQALNLCYSLLYAEVWHAVHAAGLDPFFGVMHGSARDGGSLVFDLMEAFRAPFADRTLVALLGRGASITTASDGRLSTHSRRLVIQSMEKRFSRTLQWRGRALNLRQLVHRQAREFAELVERDSRFRAYRMKW